MLSIKKEYIDLIDSGLDYYTEMDVSGRLSEVEKEIDEMTINKNINWYNLMGFVYGLMKLGYSEEFLLSRAPVELILISSKAREIEEEIRDEQDKARNSA